MNQQLKKEIIKHFFNSVGVFSDEKIRNGLIDNLLSDKFLVDKKLAFETEDNKKYQNRIWSIASKIDNSVIKILIADTHDTIPEYTIMFQMDTLPPYALRLSIAEDDLGSMYFNPEDNKWIDANTSVQARFLSGVESLNEIFVEWKKFDEYKDLYKSLIGFLNFYEHEE